MRKLIVAEKPSVAHDIARVLGVRGKGDGCLEGPDYVVTWALGHLVSLKEPDELDERYKKWRWEDLPLVPEQIGLKVLPKTRSQYNTVKKWMGDPSVTSIICATDAAREGELIFRYIYTMAKCKKPVERLWISSMTDTAIRQGFASLKPDSAYDALYESARCRSEADWIVGMNASRAFTLRYNVVLPIGRVQTPTLSMLVERDLEIERFVPQDYHELRADFGDYEGVYIDPKTGTTHITDPEAAKRMKAQVLKKTGTVTLAKKETKHVPPPQLLDLTTLQREANRKFGYSAEKTLDLAQALYERHKLLTYPRTDSRYLSSDMPKKVSEVLHRLPEPYAAMVKDPSFRPGVVTKRFYDDSKVSDHHAIIPTEKQADPGSLTKDELNIYDMTVRRLIAIHYPDQEYESARIETTVEGLLFRSDGTVPLKEGWHALYRDDSKKKTETILPDVSPGDTRTVKSASLKALKTKPPVPHNDASLLGLMENAGAKLEDPELRERMKSAGLGTPATRASIIERLIRAGYAKRSGKNILSTEKGRRLIAVVPPQISSPVTTGKWEKALYEMAENPDRVSRNAKTARFMSGIRKFAVFLVEAAQNGDKSVVFEKEPYKPRTQGRRSNGNGKQGRTPKTPKGPTGT